MPRGIPNKPKEPTEPSTKPSMEDEMYALYVHGKSINDIAEEFKVDSLEVLSVVNKIEETKG